MRWLTYAVEALLASLGGLSLALYYDSYWRWRDCFNDQGRCYDPASQNVYLEQAGLVWGGFAALFLGAALILLILRRS